MEKYDTFPLLPITFSTQNISRQNISRQMNNHHYYYADAVQFQKERHTRLHYYFSPVIINIKRLGSVP
jgi:hypothetical protein